MEAPDAEGREQLFRKRLGKYIDEGDSERLSKLLAKMTPGFVGADIVSSGGGGGSSSTTVEVVAAVVVVVVDMLLFLRRGRDWGERGVVEEVMVTGHPLF